MTNLSQVIRVYLTNSKGDGGAVPPPGRQGSGNNRIFVRQWRAGWQKNGKSGAGSEKTAAGKGEQRRLRGLRGVLRLGQLDQVVLDGELNQGGAIGRLHLAAHFLNVVAHGAFADIELRGDFAVRVAAHQ